MLRAVVDTNVFVSGLLNRAGPPAMVLDAWRSGECLLVISPPIIAEIIKIIQSPRIRTKYALTDRDIRQLIDLLEKESILVPGLSPIKNPIPEDPADEMFLSCALDAGAHVVVSGDRHLLIIKDFEGIPIMTVRQFLDRLAEQKKT